MVELYKGWIKNYAGTINSIAIKWGVVLLGWKFMTDKHEKNIKGAFIVPYSIRDSLCSVCLKQTSPWEWYPRFQTELLAIKLNVCNFLQSMFQNRLYCEYQMLKTKLKS